MYTALKHFHLTFLVISFVLFFVRGYLMMRNSPMSGHKAFLIAPHISNLFLLGSGIALAVMLGLSPGSTPWLMAKIVALVIYIGLGVMAFKHPSAQVRKILWLAALVLFAFIVSVAKSKNPLGFLAGII